MTEATLPWFVEQVDKLSTDDVKGTCESLDERSSQWFVRILPGLTCEEAKTWSFEPT